ncbi:MAG: hypothetical protein ABTD50_06670 [Polyangiaceae bacterium]
MGRGDFATACPKLAESEAIDPQVGTLLNLAYCYENVGKTATALSTWMEAASFAASKDQHEREQFALLRARWLEPRLLRVTIRVAPQPAYDRIALTLEGAPFERARWGVPVPLDRGEYELRASAPGMETWSTHLSVQEGDTPSIVVPELNPAQAETPPSRPEAPAMREHLPVAPTAPTGSKAPRSSPLVPYAFVTGGVSAAALVVGGGYGVAALINAHNSTSDRNCVNGLCNAEGQADQRRAGHDADAADAAFGIAAVAGVAGLLLWAAAATGHGPPGHVSLQAAVTPGSAGVTFGGRW